MSSCAVARDYVSTLIEPQARVRCLVYEPPREPLVEQQLEKAYGAARLALTGQHLDSEEQGLRRGMLSGY